MMFRNFIGSFHQTASNCIYSSEIHIRKSKHIRTLVTVAYQSGDDGNTLESYSDEIKNLTQNNNHLV